MSGGVRCKAKGEGATRKRNPASVDGTRTITATNQHVLAATTNQVQLRAHPCCRAV